jgi:EAL domain-containing protein (putative c-di-GMP-specific phosphodiesterase class I)
VNLSVRQLHHPDFVSSVLRVLEDTRLAPEHLELEITESLMMQDVEHCIAIFRSLEKIGVQIAIDDFGTGYSSLSYLKRLTVDRLKIDRSFVRDIVDDSDDAAIVRAVIAMGRSLGMRVVAEGVETEEQTQFLRENGCHEVQGYRFGTPMTPENFLAMAKRESEKIASPRRYA